MLSASLEGGPGRTVDGGCSRNRGILRSATLREDWCTAEVIHGLPGIQDGLPFLISLGYAFTSICLG
jgi:hypothetical protein